MKLKLTYTFMKPLTNHDSFFKCNQWNVPYIIRILNNGKYQIYDYRKYSDMEKIDFNYFSYSKVGNQINLLTAKRKIRELYLKEFNEVKYGI